MGACLGGQNRAQLGHRALLARCLGRLAFCQGDDPHGVILARRAAIGSFYRSDIATAVAVGWPAGKRFDTEQAKRKPRATEEGFGRFARVVARTLPPHPTYESPWPPCPSF
jgi:hypothetical protein